MYTYVKGQGWVPAPEGVEITMRGKRCLVYDREPDTGGYFVAMGKNSQAAQDSAPSFEGRARWWDGKTGYNKPYNPERRRENYYEYAIEWPDGPP